MTLRTELFSRVGKAIALLWRRFSEQRCGVLTFVPLEGDFFLKTLAEVLKAASVPIVGLFVQSPVVVVLLVAPVIALAVFADRHAERDALSRDGKEFTASPDQSKAA